LTAMDSLSDTDLSDYDVISNSGLDNSNTDMSLAAAATRPPVFEPPPAPPAYERFRDAIGLSAEEIQAGVLKALGRTRREERTMRVYVDGLFDGFTVG
jgi:choline-phosphate cytidylyltransferase